MVTTNITQIPYLDLITAPSVEPVTLNEVKLALRIDNNDEDGLLINMIRAAREAAENYLRRSLITQTWQLQYDSCVPNRVALPKGPVQSIESVKIIDSDWNETTMSDAAYYLNAGKEILVFEVSPIGMIIQIRYVTGYGEMENVPQQIKQGMLNHIANMYEDRVGGGTLTEVIKSQYAPFKLFRL